jgi:hypothetical protein
MHIPRLGGQILLLFILYFISLFISFKEHQIDMAAPLKNIIVVGGSYVGRVRPCSTDVQWIAY